MIGWMMSLMMMETTATVYIHKMMNDWIDDVVDDDRDKGAGPLSLCARLRERIWSFVVAGEMTHTVA